MTREEALKIAKPILFNTDMVRAILEGKKTVTRRAVKHNVEPILNSPYHKEHPEVSDKQIISKLCMPPYQPGDILYVRETWCWCPCWDCGMDTEEGCCDKTADKFYNPKKHEYGCYGYKASFGENDAPFERWRPSIHMPKEAARIFLKAKNVRVERLQDIMKSTPGPNNQVVKEGFAYGCDFVAVWNSTIKKKDLDKYGWDANPWVWVIEFEKMEVE